MAISAPPHSVGSRAALRLLLAALLTIALLGCNSRPSAPALKDGPTYRDARAGFRFFVPEGWKQRSRGQVPAGPLDKERMLVEYKSLAAGPPASLLVTVADLPQETLLSAYLAKNTLTGEEWRLSAPAEDFTINGAAAARIVHVSGSAKNEMVRDI